MSLGCRRGGATLREIELYMTAPIETEAGGASLPPRTGDDCGTALAKGVNDLLNTYVQVADTKASIFIAGSVAAASFTLMGFPKQVFAQVLYFVGACCLFTSLVLGTLAVLPRIPRRRDQGHVFWGDIAACESAEAYALGFDIAAKEGRLTAEYAELNYHTAGILKAKLRMLRYSIMGFLIGTVVSVAQHLWAGTS